MGKSTTKKQKLKLNYFKPLLFHKLILNAHSIYVIDVISSQDFSCGLTNISDKTFDFLELEKIRIPLYREDQFLIHGLNVQQDIHPTVLSDGKLQFMD